MIVDWTMKKMVAAAMVADDGFVDERIICVLDLLVFVKRALPRRCQIVLSLQVIAEI